MTVHIVSTPDLTEKERREAQELIATCQAYDKTYKEPYLSNRLNADQSMPAFFMAYDEHELVGLLAVYADSPEVEVSLLVKPSHRRRGLAKQLYQTFREGTRAYDIESVSFISERIFIEKYPDLLSAWGLTVNDDSEYLLTRDRQPVAKEANQKVADIRLAGLVDVPAIAQLKADVFDTPMDIAMTYAREAVLDEDSLLYVMVSDGQMLATCTVDTSSPDNYLYGLAVAPTHQRLGLGTALVNHIITQAIQSNDKPFQIAVDRQNTPAKQLYNRLGFVTQTEVVYLDKLDK